MGMNTPGASLLSLLEERSSVRRLVRSANDVLDSSVSELLCMSSESTLLHPLKVPFATGEKGWGRGGGGYTEGRASRHT